MDILYLVDRLENLLAGSRRMPLVNQIIVKESDILNIIDQMRTSIPEEIKQARRTNQDRERILAQAQAEATAIKERIAAQAQMDASSLLAQASEEAAQLVEREEILRQAQGRAEHILRLAEERAQELVSQAEERTDHLKKDADSYVTETLRNLREHLTSVETEVSRTILSIERGLESLESESVDLEEEDVEEVIPSSPLLPRRASLAADTMGGPSYS